MFSAVTFAQANDDFANAEAISCGSIYSGTTAAATLDEANPVRFFGVDLNSPNVWYSYTGSGVAETITLNLCNSAYDSSVLVLTGSSGSLTAIAGNDDDSTCGAGLTTRSRVSFTSDGTTTYYICVEGYGTTSTGAYAMEVTCAAFTPPAVANQSCATALAINVDGTVTNSDNSFGDASAAQPSCDLFGNIQDVWFSFVATSATVDATLTRNSLVSANMAIYSGDCSALVGLVCSSNITGASNTQSLTTLTPGNIYYVQVWSNASEQGTFTLSLGDPSVCTPVATFSKISNCPVDATFTVNVDVTNLASATTVTVTDNQGSTPQTITTASLLSFGPYVGGTAVIFTVTNDQSPGCFVTSPTQTQGVACPQSNDDCANAVTIACGDTLTNQTTEGASGGTATSCVGTIGDDVWYTFVGDGQINILTATAAANSDGAQVEVYGSTDGTCAGFTAGSCFASAGSGETTTTVTFASTLGTVYYIHIGNWINGNPAITFDLALTCSAPPTPPANDECLGAYALTVNTDGNCTSVTAGDLTGATASSVDATACGGSEDDDVWFSFVATETAQLISLTNVLGSATDLFHSLWTGDCSALSLVAGSCSDANASAPSGLTVGNTYYVRVYSFTGTPLQTTTFDVCVGTLPPAPVNDECSGAYVVTVNPDASCGSVTSGSLSGATGSAVDATSCFGTEDDDVWFSFVATSTAQPISLTNIVGSTTDMFHSLWSGDCVGLTLVPGSCSDADSSTPTGLTVGDTYYIRVYSYTATPLQNTTFDVCVGTPPPAPANDDCSGAIALTAGSVFSDFAIIGSNAGATTTAGLGAFSCATSRANDVWYSVVVPASGLLNIETDTIPGTLMTDSVVSVFSGSCGSLTEIGCNDDAGNGNFSKVTLTGLNAGDMIYVGVWRYGTTADGDFQISAYEGSLGLDSFDSANFSSYPNPVKDVLNLSYTKTISSVAIYNLLGQQVLTKMINSNSTQLDLSHLSQGTYMVKVTADNQVKTMKIVKQ